MEVHIYQVGDILFDRYRVEELLGSGSYSQVFLVTHLKLQVQRAMKCISHQQFRDIALKEADILKDLRHPAIPIIYDIEETEECICIIEEFVQGKSLKSFIFPNNTISFRDVIQYSIQLCEVTDYLYEHGICHHDIKPENILVVNHRVILLDYGSAALWREETETDLHMGTVQYAAPEMYETKRTGVEADIYSIGVVMLVMATGSVKAEAVQQLRNASFRRILEKCLKHSVKERYRSIKKLLKALKSLLKDSELSPQTLHTIHFAGVTAHCGVTHAAISCARELQKQGRHPILKENNDHGDFWEILRAANRSVFRGGVIEAEGISYLPNYYGYADPEISEGYDCEIIDEGVVTDNNLEKILSEGFLCLVTTAAPYDLKRLQSLLMGPLSEVAKDSERIQICINYASARGYVRAVREYDLNNPKRLPYEP